MVLVEERGAYMLLCILSKSTHSSCTAKTQSLLSVLFEHDENTDHRTSRRHLNANAISFKIKVFVL